MPRRARNQLQGQRFIKGFQDGRLGVPTGCTTPAADRMLPLEALTYRLISRR